MSTRTVSSANGVKLEHRVRIRQEAFRFNGSATSKQNLAKLRRFAKKELHIVVSDLTLRHLLKNGNGNGVQHEEGASPPKRVAAVRPNLSSVAR